MRQCPTLVTYSLPNGETYELHNPSYVPPPGGGVWYKAQLFTVRSHTVELVRKVHALDEGGIHLTVNLA